MTDQPFKSYEVLSDKPKQRQHGESESSAY